MVGVVFPIFPSEITNLGTIVGCGIYDRQKINAATGRLVRSEQGLFRYKGMKFISLGATEVLWFLLTLVAPKALFQN